VYKVLLVLKATKVTKVQKGIKDKQVQLVVLEYKELKVL
jgi:hypothetical protein